MNEQVVLNLIAHAVRQVLRENGAGWEPSDEERIGAQIADIAWTALIVCARETLSRGETLVIEEFGRFEVVEGSWHFDAAESLQEAKSLSLPANEGNQFLAEKALYYLDLTTELVHRVPPDTPVTLRERMTPEEEIIDGFLVFGHKKEEKFADLVRERANALLTAGRSKRDPLEEQLREVGIILGEDETFDVQRSDLSTD